MSIKISRPPIGLGNAVTAVQTTVEQSHIYHRCGLKPPHYIINLDAGNGQSTLTEYIAESYAYYGIRHFGGLDMFLEYTLDGSMEQLKKVFADINACAVYTNEFEGVISMDISKLATHVNETQLDVFLNKISRVSSSATLILYVPSTTNRNIASLIGKIHEALDDVEMINIKPYSSKELKEIIKRMISDSGIAIEESVAFDQFLLNTIADEHITSVKEAKKFSQVMVKHANFNGFLPTLGVAEIDSVVVETSTEKKVAK